MLQLVNPLSINNFPVSRSVDDFPNIILQNGVHFLIHRYFPFIPVGGSLCLSEGLRFQGREYRSEGIVKTFIKFPIRSNWDFRSSAVGEYHRSTGCRFGFSSLLLLYLPPCTWWSDDSTIACDCSGRLLRLW